MEEKTISQIEPYERLSQSEDPDHRGGENCAQGPEKVQCHQPTRASDSSS